MTHTKLALRARTQVRRGDYFSHQLTEDQLNEDTREFLNCKFQILVPHGLKSDGTVYFNCRDAVPIGVNLWRVEGYTSKRNKITPSKRERIGPSQKYFQRLNMENSNQGLNCENKPHIPLLVPKQFKGNRELRSYQVQGVNWLLRRWFSKSGAILADEMGLGKTVQVVATLEALRKRSTPRISKDLISVGGGPFIVVVRSVRA